MNEYVIFGVPHGETVEACLFTKARTFNEAQKVCKILEQRGCKHTRVFILNLNEPMNVTDNFIKSINL